MIPMNTWTEKRVEEKIRDIVISRQKETNIKLEMETEIPLDADLREDLGFDSIMLVVLQVDIEDAFHIRFRPFEDDLQLVFTTIRTLSSHVWKLLGE